jgi:hypothetical protein
VAGELEREVVRLVVDALSADYATTPEWLMRPGEAECGKRWAAVTSIYGALTSEVLPTTMPPRERRNLDAIIRPPGQRPRILEFDESQHFNHFRALTFALYPSEVLVAFPIDSWVEACNAKRRLEGGGFGKPKPPLFPGEAGRHRQRAFRDALADLLPEVHGFDPTLRIADFEVKEWLFTATARDRMATLLASRLGGERAGSRSHINDH